jgi:hypothetical protein
VPLKDGKCARAGRQSVEPSWRIGLGRRCHG